MLTIASKLFSLLKLSVALLLGFCLINSASLHAEERDAIEQNLQMSINWLNTAMASKAGKGLHRMDAAMLPMNVPNYYQFVAAAYGESPSADLGKPALSAYLQEGTLVNEKKMDICFFLYNTDSKNDLENLFIAPHRKKFGESLVPFAFIAAHELGHCIEFQHNSPERMKKRSKLQLEVSADIFAILLLKHTGVGVDELNVLTASRLNESATHSTWKWIRPAMDKNFSFPRETLIEDIWKTADELSTLAP